MALSLSALFALKKKRK
ncbi:hypothetical protein [Anaerococcus obesiensis]|nr:hypothetical protein [Anaerococcus obesiensis]